MKGSLALAAAAPAAGAPAATPQPLHRWPNQGKQRGW